MKILPLSFDRPELNLAFEDWFFEHFREETLRIWRNGPSVIVGKHQNALAECNFHFCREHNIPVIRRISGGGTVYHDPGNINFSFFRFTEKDRLIDYDSNLGLITKMLSELGYKVRTNERHDLFAGQYKVSGNAQHIRKGRALHHGTILYDSNLTFLRAAIKRTSGSFVDKSVKSVRNEILNLRSLLERGDSSEFEQLLLLSLLNQENNALAEVSPDLQAIEFLSLSKYAANSWNFGYSPAYRFSNDHGGYRVELEVDRGRKITGAGIFIESVHDHKLSMQVVGLEHDYEVLSNFLTIQQCPETIKKRLMGSLF